MLDAIAAVGPAGKLCDSFVNIIVYASEPAGPCGPAGPGGPSTPPQSSIIVHVEAPIPL